MDHAHLLSACLDRHTICRDAHCAEAVKVDPRTDRYFITMGHCGFNRPANNGTGYASHESARRAMVKYLRPQEAQS